MTPSWRRRASARRAGCDDDEVYTRLQLKLRPEEVGKAASVDAWRGLRLEMEVEWPFHLLLDDGARARYNELFQFLFQVRIEANDMIPDARRGI